MKAIYIALVATFLLTGCGRSTQLSTETSKFTPEINITAAPEWRLVNASTSTYPWKDDSQFHTLVTFEQKQIWTTPVTTTVVLDYPYLPANTAAALAFNQAIQNIVSSEVAAFLSRIATDEGVETGTANELSMTGDILAITPTFISANVAISPYFAGAAHASPYYRTLNFDFTTKTNLSHHDIFSNPESSLATVQAKAIPRLITYLNESISSDVIPFSNDDEWLKTGTAPTSTNYTNLTLTHEGVDIQFDPYQVAAYAFGAPYVTIPYGEIQNVLKPGLLERLGLN